MRSAVLCLVVASCAFGGVESLTIGTATAAAGQKATGYIRVAAGADAGVNIPVIVVRGTKPGPTLALVAGSHGTEYASILALEQLAQAADPAALTGTLIILPLVNPGSFEEKTPHINPVDKKNMNRFYPGKADGTQTERVSWAISKQVIERCDHLIDLHGGDLDESLRKYSYWARTGTRVQDEESREMVLAFGLDHIILQDFRPSAANASGAVTITRFASALGIPCVTAEAGHAGVSSVEDIDALTQGVWSVMRYLKMLPGAPLKVEHPIWIGRITVLNSDADGAFYPLANPEAYVSQGAKLGYVTDHFGAKIWDARAPVAGVIVYICSVPSMKKGNTVAYIGEIVAAPE